MPFVILLLAMNPTIILINPPNDLRSSLSYVPRISSLRRCSLCPPSSDLPQPLSFFLWPQTRYLKEESHPLSIAHLFGRDSVNYRLHLLHCLTPHLDAQF